jgi:hypothetical protein
MAATIAARTIRRQAGRMPTGPRYGLAWGLRRIGEALAMAAGLLLAVAIGYLVKSALGIDLMPGPSPLHDLLYPLLGRGG